METGSRFRPTGRSRLDDGALGGASRTGDPIVSRFTFAW